MRLRANETESAETWREAFKALAAHPGCCDEIWFSTGCGAPALDWHRANAAVLAEAMRDCREKGIVPSLQFQTTIGHGDAAGLPQLFVLKTWTGWTGPTGVETKYCNCPRQPAFLAYLRDVSRIYAPLGFRSLWIDDDLRIAYHEPSGSVNRRPGCWCDACLVAFNEATGATWTRPELLTAVEKDAAVAARWRAFQIEAICAVARTVGTVFQERSPETRLAYQHDSAEEVVDVVGAVLKTLHEVSGLPVGSRPGGSHYYDENPNEMVLKSLRAGWFRARIGDSSDVDLWTPEIECWPRTYYSRSSQGVLVEGLTALMYGMNSVSFFISNGQMESPELYGNTHWRTLAAAEPVLRGYAKAIEDCVPVGFEMPGAAQIGIRRAAIPVLAGIGRRVGTLTAKECALKVCLMKSADVQKLRDDLDRRADGLSAVIASPFAGVMQIHESKSGDFRTLALLNMCIAEQGPVVVRLRRARSPNDTVVWRELCREPKILPIERRGDEALVTIPSVGAWNGGYLAVR